jgi:hypothetical protein
MELLLAMMVSTNVAGADASQGNNGALVGDDG